MKIDTQNESAHVEEHPAYLIAQAAVKRWVSDIVLKTGTPRWITLYGASGCGKTTLAMRAKNALEAKDKKAAFRSFKKLFDDFITSDDKTYFIDRRFRLPRVLIIDDLWLAQNASDRRQCAVEEMLYYLFEERIAKPVMHIPHKWMLITTNMSPNAIAANISERIADRLYRDGNEVIDMSAAPSYNRPRKP